MLTRVRGHAAEIQTESTTKALDEVFDVAERALFSFGERLSALYKTNGLETHTWSPNATAELQYCTNIAKVLNDLIADGSRWVTHYAVVRTMSEARTARPVIARVMPQDPKARD
jgi:hypothetical protein